MTMKSTMLSNGPFVRTLRCAHSCTSSLTHSGAHGKSVFVYEMSTSNYFNFDPLCAPPSPRLTPASSTVPAFVNSSLTVDRRTAKRGEDAHVECHVGGDAPLAVTWDLLGHGFTKEQQSRLKVRGREGDKLILNHLLELTG